MEYLRQLVENGPWQLPGATHIEDEKGTLVSLHGLSIVRRRALARTLLSTPSALLPSTTTTSSSSPSPMKAKPDSSSDANGTPLSKGALLPKGLSSPSPLSPMGSSPFGTPGGHKGAEASPAGAHPRRAAAKVVYRHLRDGDLVLVNRQVSSSTRQHCFCAMPRNSRRATALCCTTTAA